MVSPHNLQPYLKLAEQLFRRESRENSLADVVIQLPPIDRELLEELAGNSQKAALTHPRLAWEICRVADETCKRQGVDLFTRSLAAWYLARAASQWEKPQKLTAAVSCARKGFSELKENGWLAACDWMEESIFQARIDFQKSLDILQNAYIGLNNSGMELFSFKCLQSIAWEQNLLNLYDEANNNLDRCEKYFGESSHWLELADCYRTRVRICTKTGLFSEAAEFSSKAEKIYRSLHSLPDLGRIYFIEGQLALYSTTDFEKTEVLFEKAKSNFRACEMDLSFANILENQAMLYLQVGKLSQARQSVEKAQRISKKYRLRYPLGDCQTLIGLIEQEQGNLDKSIIAFQQAYQNHRESHRPITHSNDLFNLGNAYAKAGRYQQAIRSLESSIDQIGNTQYPSRLGLSEMYLARVWLQLKNYQNALDHLERAEDLLKTTHQADSVVTIARVRSKIYSDLGKQDQSLYYLNQALALARQNNVPAQAAYTERILGETLLEQFSFTEAGEHLRVALSAYTEMNMQLDQAYCLLSLGKLSLLTRNLEQAKATTMQALKLSKGAYLEVEWRAKANLAEICALKKQPEKALKYYHEALQHINSIRHHLWQPSLAGSYSLNPRPMFENAIPLAIELNAPEEALSFIEADKAVTLTNQLHLPRCERSTKSEQEISHLKEEIDWLYKQIRSDSGNSNSLQSALQLRKLRKDLHTKSRQYEALISKFERKNNSGELPGIPRSFSLANFRQQVIAQYGNQWAALDYYMIGQELILISVTPDSIRSFKIPLTPRLQQAIETCQQGPQDLTQNDLALLGEALLPEEILCKHKPADLLIIAPHQQLHLLPWASLGTPYLVERGTPCLVPSLQVFGMLCEKVRGEREEKTSVDKNGLLIGISQFHGLHPDLPFVRQEMEILKTRIGETGRYLADEEASYAILAQLSQPIEDNKKPSGLKHYDWLHVASHFFSDPASGYLSGIALSTETIWLDQVRDLAPLPDLVTFSGCSSIYSRIYDGDEQIGLPSTCLLSGALTVIGSIWPIVDESSAKLMTRFYDHYLSGVHPALALAQAQREMWNERKDPSVWASFACVGMA